MKLGSLLQRVAPVAVKGNPCVNVSYLSHSCDDIKDGTLFFCLEGGTFDGHEFAEEAVSKGASALIVGRFLPVDAVQVLVRDVRRAMSVIAQNYYGNPAEKLTTVAVTGTNGKTSVCFITAEILGKAGVNCGVIGTNGIFYCGKRKESLLTTPDPVQMNATLKEMVDCGVKTVVFEASAHAIALSKLDGITADIGVFTNLTEDHLDFFGTMERYGETKRSFFSPERVKSAVVNVNDGLGAKLSVNPLVPTFTYGEKSTADAHFVCYKETRSGSSYFINMKNNLFEVKTKLFGRFNAYNATASASACFLMGIKESVIAQGIGDVSPVPGRNETVYVNGIKCVVDFAHTPDGITNILSCLRQRLEEGVGSDELGKAYDEETYGNETYNGYDTYGNETHGCENDKHRYGSSDFSAEKGRKGRLIVVFGCGGDRDREKRALMGRSASRYADGIYLTEDNSRSEKTENIIADIAVGVTVPVKIIPDRREAISVALSEARPCDTVAILGKGAEREIDRGYEKIAHSDKAFLLSLRR